MAVLSVLLVLQEEIIVWPSLALVCADGYRETCEVSYRHNSLSGCVDACLLVGEDVLGGRFVAVCLVGYGGGGGRGWLDVWDLVCL